MPPLPVRLFAACLLLAAGGLGAETYKWRDAEGKLHFSATPPPGAKAEKLEVKPAVPDPPDSAERARNLQEQREQAAFAEKQAKQKAALAAQREQQKNERQCLSLQRQLDTLKRQRPVYHVGRDGQRQYLEDNERAAEIQRKQALAQHYCR